MKLKLRFFILLFVTLSCSTNDSPETCPNWYYVYILDDCYCNSNSDSCATYSPIDKDIYTCLKNFLDESEDTCIFVDESICSEITFSGYIKEVVEDCLEIDFF